MLRHIKFGWGNRGAAILRMALAFLISGCVGVQAQNTSVGGVVRNASGEAVAGALVKVRSAELGLGFLVVSQVQGRYGTPNLLPGKYTAQAFGGGYQSAPSGPLEVRSGQPGKMDLVLSAPTRTHPPLRRMTNAEYRKGMPEGEGKRLITTRCVLCHPLQTVVRRRATRDEWQQTVELMSFYLEANRAPLADRERDAIFEYVAKNFGPDVPRPDSEGGSAPDPNGHFPPTFLQGAEAKYVAMEFDLERGVWIHDVAVDSQGIVWVSERVSGGIGRFDPKSFTYTRITPPRGKFPDRSLSAVAVDPQDRVWFSDNGPNAQLFQYNPKNQEFQTYEIIPAAPRLRPSINTLRFHRDGSVWGTGIASSRIVRLDPSTRHWTQYPIPMGSHPYGLAIGGDGAIWYTAHYGNAVVKLDPATGKLTPYKSPTPYADLRRMQADRDGNLWVGGNDSGKLVKVDSRTGKITEYAIPTENPGPFSVDVDATRNLIWFGEMYAGKLGRYDPRAGRFVEFPLPNGHPGGEFSDAKVIWIEVDRSRPNRVWWGSGVNAKIGYVEVTE